MLKADEDGARVIELAAMHTLTQVVPLGIGIGLWLAGCSALVAVLAALVASGVGLVIYRLEADLGPPKPYPGPDRRAQRGTSENQTRHTP